MSVNVEEKSDHMGVPWRLPRYLPLSKLFLESTYPARGANYWQFSKQVGSQHKITGKMDPVLAKNHVEQNFWEYNFRDVILYALSVGCRSKTDLKYLYENHKYFSVLPTFAVVPGLAACGIVNWPGVQTDLAGLVHGEQYLECFKPFPVEGKIRSETKVLEILDKKSAALVIFEVTSYDDKTNEKLSVQQFSLFQIGAGGFEGPRTYPEEIKCASIPDRAPDSVIEEKLSDDVHTLYRLGGLDLNPLHIDPEFAGTSGSDFKEPILQGLGTFGFSFRQLLKVWAKNDASSFKSIKVRFSAPILPGQTLRTESWKEEDRIVFQVKVKETGKTAISNAWIKFSQLPNLTEQLEQLSV